MRPNAVWDVAAVASTSVRNHFICWCAARSAPAAGARPWPASDSSEKQESVCYSWGFIPNPPRLRRDKPKDSAFAPTRQVEMIDSPTKI